MASSIRSQVVAAELDLERSERLLEPLAPTRADERHDVVAAGEHPGDRELRDRRALRLGDARSVSTSSRLRSRFSPVKRGAEARKSCGAERVCPFLRPVAGEEAAGEDAVGGDADPELAAGGEDLLLDSAREERVLDLQVGDRVHRVRATNRLRPDLGEADVADVARLHQLRDRADGLLDRHVGEDAAGPVDVDVVGAEPAERVGEEVLDRRRAQVVADDRAVRARA